MTRSRTLFPIAIDATHLLIAAIFLWHGVPKAIDPAMAMEKFQTFGLLPILGPITGWAEVIASLMLFIRPLHTAGVAALTVIIIGAIVTVQLGGGITAGLERDVLILVALLVLLGNGPGRITFGGRAPGTES